MTTVTKWEYLTAWRYTIMEGAKGFKKGTPTEVLEVKDEKLRYFKTGLNKLGSRGWELVTETPHVSEVEPPVLSALTSFDSTTHGRVTTHGYTLVFKRLLVAAA